MVDLMQLLRSTSVTGSDHLGLQMEGKGRGFGNGGLLL